MEVADAHEDLRGHMLPTDFEFSLLINSSLCTVFMILQPDIMKTIDVPPSRHGAGSAQFGTEFNNFNSTRTYVSVL